MKKIILLGASGNIGEQTLTILKNNSNYELVGFSVGTKLNKIKEILKDFSSVKSICVKSLDQSLVREYPQIKFYESNQGLIDLINNTEANLIVNALVGFVGLVPTLTAIKKNVNIALANKESLVVGGELIKEALKNSKSKIIPVDSEHSAIYKCLCACNKNEVSELLITASGGAFRNLTRDQLNNVTPSEALKHPTWKMGDKVTIDSATMLNKGFELIEAHYLFDVPMEQIKIIMHDESYVHSMVHLKNNEYLGEVSEPSMINPISYALSESNEAKNVMRVKSIDQFGEFHFHEFDNKRYPMVAYALKAFNLKGIMPCVLNAVDEVAVLAFLNNHISFLSIESLVNEALSTFSNREKLDISTLIRVDNEAREWANNKIKEMH